MGFEIPGVSWVQGLFQGSNNTQKPPANTAKPTGADTKDTFETPKVNGSTSVNINPSANGVDVSGGANGSVTAGQYGVSGGVKVDANIDKEVTRKDGYTTFTVSANASVTASGKVDIKAVSIGGSVSAGGNVTYQVKMKDADFEKLKAGQIPPPNPMDPSTIPDGGSVRLDESTFKGTSLDVGFRYNAANIDIGGSTKDTKGTSLLVQRNGNNVQVTAGPTDVLENDVNVKLGVGPVSVDLGNKTTLGDFDLRTATFDLGSSDGQSAFNDFAKTGKVPINDQAGVSNVLHVQKLNFDSKSDVGVHLGPIGFDLGGAENTGSRVVTTRPDGTGTDNVQLRYSDGPTVEIQREFDKSGNYVDGKTQYAFTYDTKDKYLRDYLLTAFTGKEHSPDANSDKPIRITMTEDQLKQLQGRAREWANNPAGIRSNTFQSDLADAQTPLDAALTIARRFQGQAGEAEYFLETYAEQQKEGPLPGAVTVG